MLVVHGNAPNTTTRRELLCHSTHTCHCTHAFTLHTLPITPYSSYPTHHTLLITPYSPPPTHHTPPPPTHHTLPITPYSSHPTHHTILFAPPSNGVGHYTCDYHRKVHAHGACCLCHDDNLRWKGDVWVLPLP